MSDRGVPIVTDAARYVKLVEWSEEDRAFVGECPGLIGPCCHGSDEVEVYRALCEIVEEWIEIAHRDGRPLPPPTAGTGIAQKIAWSRIKGLAVRRLGVAGVGPSPEGLRCLCY